MRPILAALVLSALVLPARAGDLRNFDDAALHTIQFVDEQEGWAAGDEGVIWHTIDGGKSWERQPSGVRASLRSLHFLNPYVGWVAGREELPLGAGSTGVLLFTRDGGCKWHRVTLNVLPGLHHVRFLDARTGYVAGDGTDAYPTGVFMTKDAGRTWQPVSGPRSPGWLAASFSDAENGVLVGAWNRLATVRRGAVVQADIDTLGGRNLRGLFMNGPRGVAVGQGGLVLLTENSGNKWSYVELKLSAEVLANWDFHTAHGSGSHVWVAGRPGSVILHSDNGGATWDVQRTGSPLPLNGLFFRDAQHGWAVGEFGAILGTTDGGKTWKVQRRGGERSAALFLNARASRLPVETVVKLGAEEGYLTAAVRVTCPDPSSAAFGQASAPARLAAAARDAGGAAGEVLWQFPLPRHLERSPREELIQIWDRLHGGKAAEQLLRQLVLAVRMWRPDVILTDEPGASAETPALDALVAEAVREVFDRAADPKAFPEQIEQLGLEAWKPAKAYSLWENQKDASLSLDATETSPRLLASIRDFAASPTSLLAEAAVMPPAQRWFKLTASRIEDSAKHKELMQGLSLAPGGLARRPLALVPEMPPELVRALRTKQSLEAIAETPLPGLSEPDRLLSQIGPMLRDLPDDAAARAAFGVASTFARRGQWALAREAYLFMVEHYPAHPLSLEAYRWLIRLNASSEARRRHELGQFILVNETAWKVQNPHPELTIPEPAPGAAKPSSEKKETRELQRVKWEVKGEVTPDNQQNRAVGVVGSTADIRRWYQGSLDLEERFAGFGPLFASDPAVQFCLQSARRKLGDFDTPKQWFTQFVAKQPPGPWRDAAQAELWLANRTGMPPKPVTVCRPTTKRPFLDGQLDDECWQHDPLVLQNAAGKTREEYPTKVWLAYDKEFLYLALRCEHPAGKSVPAVKNRRRDEDLRAFDRVSLLLDLDRDYSTCFHLQVDQRGCVREDCWGDLTWDPRWFVAVHSEETAWQVEAAIPLNALTSDAVSMGNAWACNIIRVLPGRGVQAWSLPAETPEEQLRPEGLGLLLFAAEPKPRTPGSAPGMDRVP
jgi:photosystem II stability/assembly factor-like uncharacterized protein